MGVRAVFFGLFSSPCRLSLDKRIRLRAGPSEITNITDKWNGTESTVQIPFFDFKVRSNLKFRQRIHMGGTRLIFFNKPDFIPPKNIQIKQICIVSGKDQLVLS